MSIETPAPSWASCRVYGTWHSPIGDMLTGTYKVSLPVRVTNAPDDVIVPAGVFASGSLAVVDGSPSLDIMVPANDDPDNFPSGFQLQVLITFTGSKTTELYVIDTPSDGEVNLRTIVLVQSLPAPVPYMVKGVPGGLAELDADGDVIDADGEKVIAGGGLDEMALADYLATHLDDSAFDGDYNKLSNRPTIPAIPATLPPTDGTVTDAKVATGAAISLAKTVDVTTAPGRLAMVNAERSKLAGIPADAQSAAQVDTRADARITAWVGAAPGALDTLDELAAAIADDANFAATITAALAAKAASGLTLGFRKRVSPSVWENRPVGFAAVISYGADPSPTDQVAGDFRWIPKP
jgi:hypothetical protein